MPDFNILEPLVPATFQVAWESTLKCNLDCSYCGDGHDNSQKHPELSESLSTVDFIIEYLDLYMRIKPDNQKKANINIQGGESIFHPNINEILQYLNNQKKHKNFFLSVSLITNAITGINRWKKIVELVDSFTISYHSESLKKQQEIFRKNVLYLKEKNKGFHVAVIMHPKHWNNCLEIIEWCKKNQIKHITRQIDHHWSDFRFNYTAQQAEYLTGSKPPDLMSKVVHFFKNGIDLSSQGRACCGNNTLCSEKNNQISYVRDNKFKGWHCSVDRFFLYIRQTTGEIFTNKDCEMNIDGEIGPIGFLSESNEILDNLRNRIANNTLPTIICRKNTCWCGLCAPKAKYKDDYDNIIKKYRK